MPHRQPLSVLIFEPHTLTTSLRYNYSESVLSSFIWTLIFPYLLWHAVPPSSSLSVSTESINSAAPEHRWRFSFSFLKPKPHSSALKSVTICRCTTDRKLHPSRFINRQRALSNSECTGRHSQRYASLFYSSVQLSCHVTPRKVSACATLYP